MPTKPITKYHCTRNSAKAYLERIERTVIKGLEDREQLRFQLKTVTVSLSVTIFGFAIGKGNQLGWFLLLVPAFCLFMHVLDTLLADLSIRQLEHGMRLNKDLLRFDFMNDAEIDSALDKGFEGNMPADWKRKVSLFFFPPLADILWHWGLFTVTLLLAVGVNLWWKP